MEHCKKWEAKFTHLLNTNAADEIATLYENIAKVTAAFKSKPLNLDQLADQINLLEAEQGGLEKAEGRFQPLEDMYRMLEKFEVQVKVLKKNSLEVALEGGQYDLEVQDYQEGKHYENCYFVYICQKADEEEKDPV